MLKRPTHTWLEPVLNQLDGVVATGIGSSTALHGFYGQYGIARIATGGNGSIGSATYFGVSGVGATFCSPSGQGLSSSGLAFFLGRAAYGSTGTKFVMDDVVDQLKNMGILPR